LTGQITGLLDRNRLRIRDVLAGDPEPVVIERRISHSRYRLHAVGAGLHVRGAAMLLERRRSNGEK
jgi:hypothetical protein